MVSATSLGSTVVPSGGSIIYTPADNVSGTDTFTYTVQDPSGATSTATVTVTISAVNDAPMANPNTINLDEDTTIRIDDIIVADDTDIEGDSISIFFYSQPSFGSIQSVLSTLVYVPNANYNGADSFTYIATDANGARSASVTVTVNVRSVNDAPTLQADTAATTEDTPVTFNVLANDMDVDQGDVLTLIAVTPSAGSVTFDGATGSVTFTPPANQFGTFTLTYTVQDISGATSISSATVTVSSVNDAPVANPDTATFDEDTTITINVLGNDTDVETPNGLTVTATSTTPAGSIIINNDYTLTFIPTPNYFGSSTFTYTLSDGTTTSTGTVEINVNPINDNPTAVADDFIAMEDTEGSIDVLSNDIEVDNDVLYIISTTQPRDGVIIPSATGSIRYIPNANFFGTDSFTYTITDGISISSATVSITVNPVNDAPVAQNDFAYVDEDGTILVPVLANDYDADGDSLTISAVSGAGASIQGNNVRFSPAADFFGVTGFTYTVFDGTTYTTASVVVVVIPVNDAPMVRPDTINGVEDTPISIPVLANDVDPEGSPLTISGITTPTLGTILIIDNELLFTPYPNVNGVETITYTATDGNGGFGSATVTINVAAVNDAAITGSDFASTIAGTPVTVNVLANDMDVEGSSLTVVSTSTPLHGTATIDPITYAITYTPVSDFTGIEVITYTVSDGTDISTGTLIITVTAPGATLIATADPITIMEDSASNFDLLGNDINTAPGSAIIFRGIETNPEHGTVVQNDDDTFSYTPNANFNGIDVFIYSITDGISQVSYGIVTITVEAVNDSPALGNDYASTNEDVPVTIPVLSNDIDVDGDSLTITFVADPTFGTATIQGNQIYYVPDANYFGIDTFTYTVSDGNGGTTDSTITVAISSVNDIPIARPDVATFDEDVPTVINVLANDEDAEGSPLIILFVSSSTLGTTSIEADGSIIFTPYPNVFGTDSIYYVVSDGNGGTSTATISLTIDPVNDTPIVRDDSALTQIDTSVTVNVLANDYDVEGDSLTVTAVVDSGTVVVNADNSITFTPPAATQGVFQITYTATDSQGAAGTAYLYVTTIGNSLIAIPDTINLNEDTAHTFDVLSNDINTVSAGRFTLGGVLIDPTHGVLTPNADDTFTYIPSPNFFGVDQFVYQLLDGSTISTATVFLFVAPVNDAPVAVADIVVTREDTQTIIPVLANDIDVDFDTLIITSVSTPSNGGTVTFTANGPIVYTPAANFFGTETFTYIASDGNGGTATGSVTVSVSPVNEAPIANPDTPMVTEDTAITVNVLANDFEFDGEPLTITNIGAPQHGTAILSGTSIVYTPALNYNGPDSFTYTISDASGFTSTASVSFIVSAVNDLPVVNRDVSSLLEDTRATIPVLANDFDADGDMLTISSATATVGTVNIVGSVLTYDPPSNFFGTVTITYTAVDSNGGSGTSTVTVTVTNVNDSPISTNDSFDVVEDTPTVLDVLANDSDVDGDSLQIISFSSPSSGTVARNGNVLTYTPNLNYNGPDSFTYTITDGNGATSTGTVQIRVTAVNDLPVSNPDTASTFEDTPVTIFPLANDSDVEGGTLTIVSVSDPPHGTVTFLPSGQIIYTPDANFFGTDIFTYTVSDGTGGTNVGTITVTIAGVNDSPFAVNDVASTGPGATITVDVLANDYDVDGDSITISAIIAPAVGTAVLNSDNTVTFTPPLNYVGTLTFGYTISDSTGATSSALVTLSFVAPSNAAPSINPDQLNVIRGQPNSINVLANDVDPDGFITIQSVSTPSQGTVQVNFITGVVTYTPPASFVGATSFTYTACDNAGSCGTATVSVTVSASNAPPIAISDSVLAATVVPLNINVLSNDFDPENDPITLVSVTQPALGIVIINSDQSITFTPAPGVDHVSTFTYTIIDTFGNSASASVQVIFENLPPSIVDDSFTVFQGQTLTLDVLANDFDADGDQLIISDLSSTIRGTVSIAPNGLSLLFTAASDFEGIATFIYSATDSIGGSGTATVSIAIVPPEGDIIVVPDKAVTNVNTAITLNVLANDITIGSAFDFDTFEIYIQPENGVVTLTPSLAGQVVYSPFGNFRGDDVFYYRICNEAGQCGATGVTITVLRLATTPFVTPTGAPVASATRTNGPTIPAATQTPISTNTPVATSTHGPQGSILPPIPFPTRTPVRTAAATTARPVPSSAFVRAFNDETETEPNLPVSINVLLNDVGPVDPRTLAIIIEPVYGTVSVEDDLIIYIPAVDWSGEDTFDYLICNADRTSCDDGTVTVHVFDYYGYVETFSAASSYSASFLFVVLAFFFLF